MAVLRQSMHTPSFSRRWRCSATRTRLSPRICSSVRGSLVGLAAGLRLPAPALVLWLGLAALCGFERLAPGLAGLGRMKVNSKVPPIRGDFATRDLAEGRQKAINAATNLVSAFCSL